MDGRSPRLKELESAIKPFIKANYKEITQNSEATKLSLIEQYSRKFCASKYQASLVGDILNGNLREIGDFLFKFKELLTYMLLNDP